MKTGQRRSLEQMEAISNEMTRYAEKNGFLTRFTTAGSGDMTIPDPTMKIFYRTPNPKGKSVITSTKTIKWSEVKKARKG